MCKWHKIDEITPPLRKGIILGRTMLNSELELNVRGIQYGWLSEEGELHANITFYIPNVTEAEVHKVKVSEHFNVWMSLDVRYPACVTCAHLFRETYEDEEGDCELELEQEYDSTVSIWDVCNRYKHKE